MWVHRQGMKRYKHMIGYSYVWWFLRYLLSKSALCKCYMLTTEWMFYSICMYWLCVCVFDKTKACCWGGRECLSRVCIQLPDVGVCFQHFSKTSFWIVAKENRSINLLENRVDVKGTFSPASLTLDWERWKCKMCQVCVSLCTLMGLVRDYSTGNNQCFFLNCTHEIFVESIKSCILQ